MDQSPFVIEPRIADAIVVASREAGALAMAHFRKGLRTEARIDWKAGGSPVTEADFEVDAFLRERLGALIPDAGWLSEETADTPARLDARTIFVVDPIDGTRGFMDGDPRFAISIALVVDNRPVLAVIEAPAVEEHYFSIAGQGATCNGRRLSHDGARPAPRGLAGPKYLVDRMAGGLGLEAQPKIPSLALRFARVAAGDIEAAIASPDAHDWDVAAADLLLSESGCVLRSLDDRALIYNQPKTKHDFLLAAPGPFFPTLRDALSGVIAERDKRPEMGRRPAR